MVVGGAAVGAAVVVGGAVVVGVGVVVGGVVVVGAAVVVGGGVVGKGLSVGRFRGSGSLASLIPSPSVSGLFGLVPRASSSASLNPSLSLSILL